MKCPICNSKTNKSIEVSYIDGERIYTEWKFCTKCNWEEGIDLDEETVDNGVPNNSWEDR
jgi:hypothetical protein